eukprot:1944904-Pyramimonas_sp.AAC.1
MKKKHRAVGNDGDMVRDPRRTFHSRLANIWGLYPFVMDGRLPKQWVHHPWVRRSAGAHATQPRVFFRQVIRH